MSVPVVDCHNDLLLHVLYQRERGARDPFGDFWLPQLKAGGVVCQVLPVCTQEQFAGEAALRRCLLLLEEAYRLADVHRADVAVVTDAAELSAAIDTGRIALLLAIEGAEPVGRDLAILDVLQRLGVRMMSLTWNRRTAMADGAAENGTGGRLTGLGVDAVAELERLGIVVDVSHLSDPGFWHVHELATRPYLASHSCARALRDHPRNLTDAQITAVAERGGVVGIAAYGAFLADAPDVHDVVRHVRHMVDLVGAEHVALGPDFFDDIASETNPVVVGHLAATPRTGAVAARTDGLVRPADLAAAAELLTGELGEDAAAVLSGSALRFLDQNLPALARSAVGV